MDTLLGIAILVIILWLVLSVIYLYLGRQQRGIQNEIEAIRDLLGDEDDN